MTRAAPPENAKHIMMTTRLPHHSTKGVKAKVLGTSARAVSAMYMNGSSLVKQAISVQQVQFKKKSTLFVYLQLLFPIYCTTLCSSESSTEGVAMASMFQHFPIIVCFPPPNPP